MPDPGKLAALAGAAYRVQRSCGTCEHFSGGGGDPWGTCHRIAHVHAKHGARDRTGVRRDGVCPSHAFAPLIVDEIARAGYARFLPLDARPVDQLADDRSLVARLAAIEEGLTDWEVTFVESLSRWVESKALTTAQRDRALQIDGRG